MIERNCSKKVQIKVHKVEDDAEARDCDSMQRCAIDCEFRIDGMCDFDFSWDSPDFSAEACPRWGYNMALTDEDYEAKYGFSRPFNPGEDSVE